MKVYKNLFDQVASLENLFTAWDNFKTDKRHKLDVMRFEWELEENIFQLSRELKSGEYRHGPYEGFFVHDPKQRHIHKASVRDRILHHAVFSVINPIFEPTFIATSFSCRVGYGTHRGVETLARMLRRASKNNTRTCYVLKCDVRKFFDSVDHTILLGLIEKRVKDEKMIWLLRSIVESYSSEIGIGKGVPIGNLTSQLFANIYMNEFDQFVKHIVREKRYVRYTDDFAIVSENPIYLKELLPKVEKFLFETLAVTLHPNKIILSTFCQGIDFLGYVSFPKHRLLRTKTKKRILKKMRKKVSGYRLGELTRENLHQSLQSYLGVLSHANTYRLSEQLKNETWW